MNSLHKNNPPEKRKPNHIPIYYSEEFCDLVHFIKQETEVDVYLTGLRAMLEHGMPAHRLTEDFDIYALITQANRDKVTNYVRNKYPKSKHIWKKWDSALISTQLKGCIMSI